MKFGWTSEECRDKLNNITSITYNDLLSQGNLLPTKKKVEATFQFATRAQTKYRAFHRPNGKLQAKTQVINVFEIFFVLGTDNTSNVCLVFLNAYGLKESLEVLRRNLSRETSVYIDAKSGGFFERNAKSFQENH